jgi:hypothetical protein
MADDDTLFGGVTAEERRQIINKSSFPDETPCPGCGHKVAESHWWSTRIPSKVDGGKWDWWHTMCLRKKVYSQ